MKNHWLAQGRKKTIHPFKFDASDLQCEIPLTFFRIPIGHNIELPEIPELKIPELTIPDGPIQIPEMVFRTPVLEEK